MSRRARVLGPLVLLLAAAAVLPLSVEAAGGAGPSLASPCLTPIAAVSDFKHVSAVVPTAIDVLTNDCRGAAVNRPLVITAVTQGDYGGVTTDGGTVVYDPRACSLGDGGHNDLFTYTISDGVQTRVGTVLVQVDRPATTPLTDVPQVGFVANSTLGSTVPLRVTWCGVTAGNATVRSYRLAQGTNGGTAFPTVIAAGTTSTSATRNARPGTDYAWQVRTTDSKGRFSAAASLPSKVTVFQESNPAVVYSAGWSTASGASYSGGKERYTSKAGATATINVTNVRAIALVASKAAGRGSYNIYVDGVKVTPSAIKQASATAVWRRVLYIRGLSSGAGVSHTVQLRAVGNGRVDIDAFLALSGKRDQAITLSSAPVAATYAGTAYNVTASATSLLPVTLAINSASWGVCTVTGTSVTFQGTGTCRIDASQAGDATFNARTASQSFAVAKKPIDVTGITAVDRDYDGTAGATLDTSGAALDVTDIAGSDAVELDASGATGTFTPDGTAGDDKTVTITGLVLTGADAGKYQALAAPTTASIAPAGLTVSFTADDKVYDGTTAAVIAAGCTVSTPIGADDVTCDDSAATASFAEANAGTDKTVTGSGFTLAGADKANYTIDAVNATTADITMATQTISFTTTPPNPVALSDTYTPDATATSGLPVDFSIDASSAGVCHITAGVVSMDGAGTCTVNADQDGDGNYQPAAQVPQSFAVTSGGPAPQTISFDLSAVTATYGDGPIDISGFASATSGLPVSFASDTPLTCFVSGNDVQVLAAGSCQITASQAGNASWNPAPDVQRSFTAAKLAITVTAVSDTKVADGTTSSDETPIVTGTLAAGDTATFIQAFNTAAAGTGKTLTPSGSVFHGLTDVGASYAITPVTDSTGVITPAAADVTTSRVTVQPASVQNDGVDTVTVTVQLVDAFGNLLTTSGGTVTINADHGSIGLVTDHGDGHYTATYTSDTTPGQTTVTVTAALDGAPLTDDATINQH